MAGKLKEAEITTPNARSKLAPQAKPYWRRVDAEIHIGYRKGRRSGAWVVRWAVGGGNYHQEAVGTANDATSVGTLSFDQAVKRGIEIVEQARKDEAAAAAGPIETVKSAVRSYIAKRNKRDTDRRGREVRSDADTRLSRHVLSHPIATKTLAALAPADVLAWQAALPGKETTHVRLWSDLRAALAAKDCKVKLPKRDDGDRDEYVETAREGQILTTVQVAAIVAAAFEHDQDFGRLVMVLAATGARLSQVVRLKISDFQPGISRLSVPSSRKGSQRNKLPSINVTLAPGEVAALAEAAKGRGQSEPLLERNRAGNGRPLTRGAWKTASEMTKPWAAALEAVGMKDSKVVPYSLRHSSIVRWLRQNIATLTVANRHDTSPAMIQRHYGKFIQDSDDELAARMAISFAPATQDSNVHRIRSA